MKRPTLLTIFAIFSFIGAVFNAIFNSIMLFLDRVSIIDNLKSGTGIWGQLKETMPKNQWNTIVAQYEQIFSLPNIYWLSVVLLYCLSFYGVLQLWKLNKTGLHFYAIAQIALLIVTVIYVGTQGITGSVLWTLLFILVYYLMLKKAYKDNQIAQ